MGCWYETCGISRMPIIGGEKCYVVILCQNTNLEVSPINYSSDMAHPLCFPFYGKYDDYGSMENIKDEAHVYMFEKWLKEKISEKVIIGTRCKTVDGLVRDISQGHVKMIVRETGTDEKVEVPLSLMFINEDIYNYMINFKSDDGFDSWIKEVMKKTEQSLDKNKFFFSGTNISMPLKEVPYDDELLKMLRKHSFHRDDYDSPEYRIGWMMDYVDDINKDEFMKAFKKFRIINSFMYSNRIPYIAGMRSQCQEYESLVGMSKLVINLVEKRLKEWEDEENE